MRFGKNLVTWFSSTRTCHRGGGDGDWLALFAYAGIGGNGKAGFVFLQDIEQRSLDLRFGLRGSRQTDLRIVIVGIDEKTLQEIGSYPLPAVRMRFSSASSRKTAPGHCLRHDISLPESNQALLC